MSTDNSNWILYWRLSPSSATLARGFLIARKIPPPDLADYRTYTQKFAKSQGGLNRQGYTNISILWNQMDFGQLKALTDVVEAAITNGSIYATIPKDDGSGLNAFIDVHGQAHPVEYQPISNGRGVMASNVNLVISAIVIDADPSTVL